MDAESIPFSDVFYPTKEEFADFQGYVNKIEKIATSGIVKVRPKAKSRSFRQKAM